MANEHPHAEGSESVQSPRVTGIASGDGHSPCYQDARDAGHPGPANPDDVDLSKARKAEDVHEKQVKAEMERIKAEDPEAYRRGSRVAA